MHKIYVKLTDTFITAVTSTYKWASQLPHQPTSKHHSCHIKLQANNQ